MSVQDSGSGVCRRNGETRASGGRAAGGMRLQSAWSQPWAKGIFIPTLQGRALRPPAGSPAGRDQGLWLHPRPLPAPCPHPKCRCVAGRAPRASSWLTAEGGLLLIPFVLDERQVIPEFGLSLAATLLRQKCPCFSDEEIEARRGQRPHSRPPSEKVRARALTLMTHCPVPSPHPLDGGGEALGPGRGARRCIQAAPFCLLGHVRDCRDPRLEPSPVGELVAGPKQTGYARPPAPHPTLMYPSS